MSYGDFSVEEVFEHDPFDRIPEVSDPKARSAAITAAVKEVLDENTGASVSVRMGAVWSRKGSPDFGSVSEKVSPGTGYRGRDSDTLVLIALVIPSYIHSEEAVAAVALVAEADEQERERAREEARQAKLARAASLRAEAEKLESEAARQP